MNIVVIGAGAWGTALAISLAAHHSVILCARDREQIESMRSTRCNQRYLPDISLPNNLQLTSDLSAVLSIADLAIIAVPTAALRSVLQQLVSLPCSVDVVWLCKGFEAATSRLPHQVMAEVLPKGYLSGVLSGPSFAQEVARGLPTALTFASSDKDFALRTAQVLHHKKLRIYASSDVIGVEVGAAVKNVMALATGICDGMNLGLNARAALIARGLAEISRLGLKLGGQVETLSGLSGAGDLILTCTGDLSRNRQVGLRLAKGQSLPEILEQLGHVAEGVYTAKEVSHLAQQLGVDMPICDAVYRILYEQASASDVVSDLLDRAPQLEFNSS